MLSKISFLALVAVSLAQPQGYGKATHAVHDAGYKAPSYAPHSTGYKAPSYAPHSTGYKAPSYAPHSTGYKAPSYAPHSTGYKQETYEEPKPYQFGFDIKDDYNTQINRKESGDGYGNVQGSYGYSDASGLYRQVEYTADDYGFKAYVKTNEPGTDNQNPADVEIYADPKEVKYDAPKKGYGHGVAHSGSYQAPSYGHRSAYKAPVVHKKAHVSTHRRGYDNHGNGYGHASHVATHKLAPVHGYSAPAVHKTAHVSTHRRGYDNHGYGHASHVATHKLAPVHGYAAPVHSGYVAPVVHKTSHASTHRRGYDKHGNGYGHDSHVATHKVHH